MRSLINWILSSRKSAPTPTLKELQATTKFEDQLIDFNNPNYSSQMLVEQIL